MESFRLVNFGNKIINFDMDTGLIHAVYLEMKQWKNNNC